METVSALRSVAFIACKMYVYVGGRGMMLWDQVLPYIRGKGDMILIK